MSDTSLGQRIAERRKLLGLSQEAFGDKMGVSRQAISKWEADSSTPEIEKLITMSKLFEVSMGWLLGTEPDDSDLSAQIRIAFQPPQSEPAAPSTAVPSAPEPTPQPNPEEPLHRWLRIGFAVAAVLSLILSLMSIYLISLEPQNTLSETPTMDTSRIAELENQLTDLSKQLEDLKTHCYIWSNDCDNTYLRIKSDFDELAQLISTGTEIPEPSDTLPTYENLEKWSLTGMTTADISKVTVTLNATTSIEIKSARFSIRKNDKEVLSTACTVAGRSIYATAELSAADGYQYILTLTHRDGTVQQITLTGHNLSDLTVLALPQLRFTRKQLHRFGPECFTQGFFSIHLEIPYLTSSDSKWEWSDLRISYYHNEGLVEEVDLKAELTNVVLTEATLSFKASSHTYDMYYVQDGDTHDLRLQGTLTIDGVENQFSMPLVGWIIKDGEFVQII